MYSFLTLIVIKWSGWGAGAWPGSVSLLCVWCPIGAVRWSFVTVSFLLSKELCPAGTGGRGSRQRGREQSLSARVSSTSQPRDATCLPQPGGNQRAPQAIPGSWGRSGVLDILDHPNPASPGWFHFSMNSQVSRSEERDNQPILVLSPRVVGDAGTPQLPEI